MERIAMNQEERDWLEWLKRVQDGVVTQRQAAAKMGVSDRWVRKLLARMQSDGDRVVVHGLRGRVSNRQIDAQTQARAIVLLKQPEWHDFGPTFASEQLAKRHSIEGSKETVRGWMVAAGLWKAHPRKLGEAHFWRQRRGLLLVPARPGSLGKFLRRASPSFLGRARVGCPGCGLAVVLHGAAVSRAAPQFSSTQKQEPPPGDTGNNPSDTPPQERHPGNPVQSCCRRCRAAPGVAGSSRGGPYGWAVFAGTDASTAPPLPPAPVCWMREPVRSSPG
jgi:hypothetical protein